jgi:hypothetical protein
MLLPFHPMVFIMNEIVEQIIVMGFGSVISWAAWVTTAHFKMRRDLDAAFTKIRDLQNARPRLETRTWTYRKVDDRDILSPRPDSHAGNVVENDRK